MEKAIALLRGINVGTAKRVAMADLRALVESLGYIEVRSLLNSGNVVFGVPARTKGDPAALIKRGMAEQLGVTSTVTVISAELLTRVIAENPLAGVSHNSSHLLAAFFRDPADLAKVAPLIEQSWLPDVLALGSGAAYLWCGDSVHQSKLFLGLNRIFKDRVTTRNWATLLKLQALCQPLP